MRGPARLGIAFNGAGGGIIDLGNAPPLTIDGEPEPEQTPIQRAVSLRWLSGTILTGFTSIFLMGGALMAALNNPNQFVPAIPEFGSSTADSSSADSRFGHKGDRIKPIEEEVSSRQIIQVSTITRQAERDFIKLKPFAKINATLATHKFQFADQIPAYDALAIFADTSAPDAPAPVSATPGHDDEIYGANVDGEVSVKVSAFPGDAKIDGSPTFDAGDVEAMVRAAAHIDQIVVAPPTDAPAADADTADSSVRIIPENVSNIAKSAGDDGSGHALDERMVTIAKGQSFRSLLQDNDVAGDDADEIIAALANLVDLNNLHAGEKVRIAFAASADGAAAAAAAAAAARPVRVSLYDDGVHQATVARADNNRFVRANEPSALADTGDDTPAPEPADGMPKLYDALYETALEQQVPKPLIEQLIRIFAYDVDYTSRVSPGDALEVFHSMPDPSDAAAGDPEVLYASLTLSGVTKRFYRFRSPDDGVVDYYDEDGKSGKKFLMRKPMTLGIIRSGFGWRIHPILGRRILHTGVDYAAPRMTPIMAAGDGVVERAGPSSGYGNFTLIKHTNGYETGYGHQTSFAKGLVPGARVRQGQIIGYVGSTGLSTGPHLHFEIRVNGKPVDPLRIRLPRGRVLSGDMLASFEHERNRIDALLGNNTASTKVAAAAAAGN